MIVLSLSLLLMLRKLHKPHIQMNMSRVYSCSACLTVEGEMSKDDQRVSDSISTTTNEMQTDISDSAAVAELPCVICQTRKKSNLWVLEYPQILVQTLMKRADRIKEERP